MSESSIEFFIKYPEYAPLPEGWFTAVDGKCLNPNP